MGDASDIQRYDRRTPELSNAPLHMKQDSNSIEIYPLNINLRLRLMDLDLVLLTCRANLPLSLGFV